MTSNFDSFVYVNKKDPQVQNKLNVMLDKYMSLPYDLNIWVESKTGCNSLIQNVILKDLNNILCTTIIDLNIELKMKIIRIEYLETKKHT